MYSTQYQTDSNTEPRDHRCICLEEVNSLELKVSPDTEASLALTETSIWELFHLDTQGPGTMLEPSGSSLAWISFQVPCFSSSLSSTLIASIHTLERQKEVDFWKITQSTWKDTNSPKFSKISPQFLNLVLVSKLLHAQQIFLFHWRAVTPGQILNCSIVWQLSHLQSQVCLHWFAN